MPEEEQPIGKVGPPTTIPAVPLDRTRPRLSLTEVFLRLCELTTPHGHEAACWPLIPRGPTGSWEVDMDNNLHVLVPLPNGQRSRVIWSSHLDGACHKVERVRFVRRKNMIGTDGKTILGADDKIGAALMIMMIDAGVPGWYIFHAGEERGRKGSEAHARTLSWKKDAFIPDICISFDRWGTTEVITHQMGKRCCSDEFGLALAEILNRQPSLAFKPSPAGLYTDSYSYSGMVPECVNLSVGYYGHHSDEEQQDIGHAHRLLTVILAHHEAIESLPVTRDFAAEKEEQKQQRPFAQRWDEEANKWVPWDSDGSGTPTAGSPKSGGMSGPTTSGMRRRGTSSSGGGRRGQQPLYPSKAAKKEAKRQRREQRLFDRWKSLESKSTGSSSDSIPSEKRIVAATSTDLEQLIGGRSEAAIDRMIKKMDDRVLFSEAEYTAKDEPGYGQLASFYRCGDCHVSFPSAIPMRGASLPCRICGRILVIRIYKYDSDVRLFVPCNQDFDGLDCYYQHELPYPPHGTH